jgi:predicted component of type VI protein secretion system
VQGKPEVFPLKQGKRLTIGRGKGNDIVLPEVAASRKHAEVFPGPGGFYLRDLGSSNGVIVNSTRIDNPYLLVHGDRFTIGIMSTYFLDARASSMVGDNVPARSSSSDSPKPAVISPGNVPCPNCGTSNIPVARFCANCGSPLDRVSPARA